MADDAADIIVGIDVAKDWVDVAVRPTGETWRAAHDEEGIAALVQRLHGLRPGLVVLEATAGMRSPWPSPWAWRMSPSRW